MTFQNDNFFWFSVSSWDTHLSRFFTFPILLQMPNDCRMVDVEFFSNFSCSCERVSLNDPLNWLFSTSNDCPLCLSSWRPSSPLQNFLNHHCTVCSLAVPWSNVLLMLWVVLAVLRPILNLDKKITQICFLSNIIFLA